jgi:enediyne polyketide synthase
MATPAGPWAEPLLATFVERQIAEIVPRAELSVVLERSPETTKHRANGHKNGHYKSHSDAAVSRALGYAAEVLRRPDGKPEVTTGVQVSVAHAVGRTLSVAAANRIGCDLEAVIDRPADDWRELLGPDRFRLAEELVAETHDINAAATRLWTVLECLKKVGIPANAPLTRRPTAPEGWVVFESGRLKIATFIADLRDLVEPVVLAVLLEEPFASLAPQANGGLHLARHREELTGT